ncbi:HAMP domain-containing sensor histidine kinase [Hydrogenophaga intermedia]|uniref:HAMP domain-containing sensor histidine kinase n=1 Tax=Hydrogenophaga intermedia TaxID=65786 RepID=UPI002043ED3A|nr:HAMP domain-containing sensor histidine kinase [Hydrogenophaga intermedia]MCM3563609.1 HAMP domain-containing histidine kinase [Hydrogenophaga intermedia]
MAFGQRLYLRIWLAVVAAVTVVTLVVGWLWQQALERDRAEREARVTRTIIIENAAGDVLGDAPARAERIPGVGWRFEVVMRDGEKLYVLLPRSNNRPSNPGSRAPAWLLTPAGFAWLLGMVAVAVALGAYPIVRRLTRRLETLQKGVERWGAGDLSARMPVTGEDEVAFLAERFNTAAERVQSLLQAHKRLLANASHELRSPLARIRMGLALVGDDPAHRAQRAEIARSIEELDQLIDEILLASRLDLRDAADPVAFGAQEDVDLLGLAAEECARTGAELDVAPDVGELVVHGHARLLRRVVRNLLENARRYGRGAGKADAEVRLTLARQGAVPRVVLAVEDRGPGVPHELREQIFEPFYRLPGASESEGGVGLGLSLVRTIVARHGGTVHCEDRPGGGARFVVSLPVAARA